MMSSSLHKKRQLGAHGFTKNINHRNNTVKCTKRGARGEKRKM